MALDDDEATTEYDLADWPVDDRDVARRGPSPARAIPYRWEGEVLLVRTSDEALIESLLDLVEPATSSSSTADDDDEHAEADRLPFETLTTFFLAGERLKRNPLDADGLEDLLAAVEVAEPDHPPYGVDPRLWQRTCELADDLAGALVDDDDARRGRCPRGRRRTARSAAPLHLIVCWPSCRSGTPGPSPPPGASRSGTWCCPPIRPRGWVACCSPRWSPPTCPASTTSCGPTSAV